MDKIILNDGTEIAGGMISKSGGEQILVSIPGDDIVQAAIIFGDPNKTKKMLYTFGIFEYEYKNFINMGSLSVDKIDYKVRIYMTGENTEIKSSYTVPEIYVPKDIGEANNG